MRKWLPLMTICLGTLMLLVDVTIVNVALPAMASDLHTSFTTLQWVIDGYALALAALVMGAGTVADRVGHRRGYAAGLVLFAAASLCSGLADDATLLVTARIVQGVGGAIMFATTFALLNRAYAGRERGVAYGIWGATSGAAAALGPIVGGLLTEGISWRWIFFVNLPVSVLALAMTATVLSSDDDRSARRLDLAGIMAFTGFASALTYGLIRAGSQGWSDRWVLVCPAAAVIALVMFVDTELHVREPLLDLTLLRHRGFVGSVLAALVLSFVAFADLAYVSIWLQSVLGLSPIQAGLVSMPLSAASFLVSAVTGRLVHGRAPHWVIGGGVIAIGAGQLVMWAQLSDSARWPALLAGLAVTGVGVGFATPALSSTAMGAVDARRGGMAAGAVNTARQLGLAIGLAVLGSLFTARAGDVLRDAGIPHAGEAAQAVGGGQGGLLVAQAPAAFRGTAEMAVHNAAAQGLSLTFLVAGLLGVLAGIGVLLVLRERPEHGRHSVDTVPVETAVHPGDLVRA